MHLIKDHKLHVSNEIRPLVEHAPQNLRRHNKTVCFRIDLHIARKDANRAGRERLFEVPELLVREGFDG